MQSRSSALTCVKKLTRRLSKSSPPRWVSPAVDLTSKMPSSMVSSDTYQHRDKAASMSQQMMENQAALLVHCLAIV